MSAEMRDFAAAFSHGMDRGVGMYQKEQDRAIQREHNKLLRDQHEATARNADRRTDIYAESVKSAAETNRIKAQAALNKGAGKGGGAAVAAPNPDKYAEGAASVGLTIPRPQPLPSPAPSVTNIYPAQDSDATPITPPGDGMRKGGMVKKYADGGMTVSEALSYGPRAAKEKESTPATATSALGTNFASAYEKSAANAGKEKPKPEITQDPRVGPSLKTAEADVDAINQAIATAPPRPAAAPPPVPIPARPPPPAPVAPVDLGLQRGGMIRKFQSGGRVMETAIDTGTSGPGSGYGYRAAPPARRY